MVADDTTAGGRPGDDHGYDHRYFGPFGPTPPAEDQWGGGATPNAGPTPGPTFESYGTPVQPSWAPPAPVAPPVTARGGSTAGASGRRRSRGGRLVGLTAASLAAVVLVGGAAGYGGARLADRGAGASGTPSAVSPAPSASTASSTPAPTAAVPLPKAPGSVNTVEVAKRGLASTVMIQVGNGTGSGFVLDDEGRIMTNNHVVAAAADGAKIRVVFAGGKRQTAKLVGRSPSYDIAVIKVSPSSALTPMAVGNSDQTEVGQPVVAIGSPLGLPGTVTQGIVSARDRPVVVGGNADADAPTAYINAIQTDAPINPGNSGGPLVDAEARVIGVNSAILTMGSGQSQTGNIGIGFAIPFNQARAVGDQLVKKGKATYPVLGANVRTASGGVQVTSVEDSGPARKAGLRKGDLITKIDGDLVAEMDELIVAIRTRRPGEVVALDYTRSSSKKQVKVTLGSRVG